MPEPSEFVVVRAFTHLHEAHQLPRLVRLPEAPFMKPRITVMTLGVAARALPELCVVVLLLQACRPPVTTSDAVGSGDSPPQASAIVTITNEERKTAGLSPLRETQAWAENLAFGFDPAAVVGGWMASPGHRANILNPTYTETGVGFALDRSGRRYYAQVFGRPRR